jgi:hypothetical protein
VTLELPAHVTQAEVERIKKARGNCHRAFFTILTQQPMTLQQAMAMSGQRVLSPDANPDEQVMANVPQGGAQICIQEKCRMWDKKRQQCLDRLVALKIVYGDARLNEEYEAPKEEGGG